MSIYDKLRMASGYFLFPAIVKEHFHSTVIFRES